MPSSSSYTPQKYEMTALNHSKFHRLRALFTALHEPRRGTVRARNEVAMSKSCERICGFLGWLQQSGREKYPSFVNFETVELFLVNAWLLLRLHCGIQKMIG